MMETPYLSISATFRLLIKEFSSEDENAEEASRSPGRSIPSLVPGGPLSARCELFVVALASLLVP